MCNGVKCLQCLVKCVCPLSFQIEPPRPLSSLSSSSSNNSVDVGDSQTEILHKLPAMYVGSARASSQDSVSDVIQRVLQENRPTQAQEVSVWLSLAHLRLVDSSKNQESTFLSHETGRIRAIGVYSTDKRFIGYVVKEEGRPLTAHILRCNSAGLMVSMVSFLRQACQIMFFQQGASIYSELSTDESDEEASQVCTIHFYCRKLYSH